MSKRQDVYLGSAKVIPGGVCPNCWKHLDGVTRVTHRVNAGPVKPVAGAFTVCCHCGALLVFKNDKGEMRLPTAKERKYLAENKELLARVIKNISKETAAAFWTKTGMRGKT